MAQISDEAFVVWGGRTRPEDIARAIGVHPSGVVGISVASTVFADFHNADEQGRLRLNCAISGQTGDSFVRRAATHPMQ